MDKTNPPYYEVEDVETSHEDETMMHALPFNEVIQILEAPTHEEVNTISYFLSKILMMLYFMIWKVKKC